MKHRRFQIQPLLVPQSSNLLSEELSFLLTSLKTIYKTEQHTSTQLHISDNLLGQGGNGSVLAGVLHGKQVAVKISEIDRPLRQKILTKARIFRDLSGIKNLLLPHMLYIDTPCRSGVGGLQINSSNFLGYLYEVYDICHPYKIPSTLFEFLYDLKCILSTLLQMHHMKIAHLDLKIENLMCIKNICGQSEIIITDLGESQYTRPNPAQTPISTTTRLITQNDYIQTILYHSLTPNNVYRRKIVEDFLCEFEGGGTLKCLIMYHTPPQGYRLIDALMFGIFLQNLPRDITETSIMSHVADSPSHVTLKSRIPATLTLCGKKLIVSALHSLYSTFWHPILMHDIQFTQQLNIFSGLKRTLENDFLDNTQPINLIDLYNVLSHLES